MPQLASSRVRFTTPIKKAWTLLKTGGGLNQEDFRLMAPFIRVFIDRIQTLQHTEPTFDPRMWADVPSLAKITTNVRLRALLTS